VIKASFLIVLLVAVFAVQEKRLDFVIDSSKPYVYLKFDHVGSRTPLGEGENSEGLWLRIVNNCRLPIEVYSMGNAAGNPGAIIFDEVIPISTPRVRIEIGYGLDEITPPKPTHQAGKPPEGYSAELSSGTIIEPGNELLFSVPRNHVSDEWFMRVKFVLVVSPSSIATGPWTELSFSNHQIPVDKISH
jgi:hypothetical protein